MWRWLDLGFLATGLSSGESNGVRIGSEKNDWDACYDFISMPRIVPVALANASIGNPRRCNMEV